MKANGSVSSRRIPKHAAAGARIAVGPLLYRPWLIIIPTPLRTALLISIAEPTSRIWKFSRTSSQARAAAANCK